MGDSNNIRKPCTRMRLWELPDKYVLEPTDHMATEYLSIDRSSGDLSYTSKLASLYRVVDMLCFHLFICFCSIHQWRLVTL